MISIYIIFSFLFALGQTAANIRNEKLHPISHIILFLIRFVMWPFILGAFIEKQNYE